MGEGRCRYLLLLSAVSLEGYLDVKYLAMFSWGTLVLESMHRTNDNTSSGPLRKRPRTNKFDILSPLKPTVCHLAPRANPAAHYGRQVSGLHYKSSHPHITHPWPPQRRPPRPSQQGPPTRGQMSASAPQAARGPRTPRGAGAGWRRERTRGLTRPGARAQGWCWSPAWRAGTRRGSLRGVRAPGRQDKGPPPNVPSNKYLGNRTNRVESRRDYSPRRPNTAHIKALACRGHAASWPCDEWGLLLTPKRYHDSSIARRRKLPSSDMERVTVGTTSPMLARFPDWIPLEHHQLFQGEQRAASSTPSVPAQLTC